MNDVFNVEESSELLSASSNRHAVIDEERVPAEEKVVSVFEEHTDIIRKDRFLPSPSVDLDRRDAVVAYPSRSELPVEVCRTALEDSLKQRVPPSSLIEEAMQGGKTGEFERLINAAVRARVLPAELRQIAHDIRKRANDVLHQADLKVPDPWQLCSIKSSLMRELPGAKSAARSSPGSRFEPAVRTPGGPVARHPQLYPNRKIFEARKRGCPVGC